MANYRGKASKVMEVREEIINLIDKLTEPKEMTKQEALTVLEEITTELEMRSEALKEEIEYENANRE